MLVRWNDKTFLLVYLVEYREKANQVVKKIQEMVNKNITPQLNCNIVSITQEAKESLSMLIDKIEPN